MEFVTNFHVKDNYQYLEGWGAYHSSEAIPGANSKVINNPQKPAYGLRTERLSGTSFTTPRELTLQTFMYRATASVGNERYVPIEDPPEAPTFLSPHPNTWANVSVKEGEGWLDQHLILRGGDPLTKNGVAFYLFSITEAMPEDHAFTSFDGDCLILPQSGALHITTELGRLMVRQNEFCIIPRGLKYHVSLPTGACRGYICEVFQGHFQLPNLGIIGSTGLANVRDFQIPTAYFDGVVDNKGKCVANDKSFTVFTRQGARLWKHEQPYTPFNVAAWHGTCYPIKYDLSRFCPLGNTLFEQHDPCLYGVLTVPSYREPGTGVVDFGIVPAHWKVAEDTFWLPYYHRNTMNEVSGPIVRIQDPKHPLNQGTDFKPSALGHTGSMVTHGCEEEEFQHSTNGDTKPTKAMNDGVSLFFFETEMPLLMTEWARKTVQLGGRVDYSIL